MAASRARSIGGQTVLVRPVQARTRTAARPSIETPRATPRDEPMYDLKPRKRKASPTPTELKRRGVRKAATMTLGQLAQQLGIQDPKQLFGLMQKTPLIRRMLPQNWVPNAQAPVDPKIVPLVTQAAQAQGLGSAPRKPFSPLEAFGGQQQEMPQDTRFEQMAGVRGSKQPGPRKRRDRVARMILGQ